ncbi:MAG: hypothetical protein U5O39_08840 [Gammaproteobacteria bacterium]|nr:hypothetical protein [Gammaproteobacteria bacterium]
MSVQVDPDRLDATNIDIHFNVESTDESIRTGSDSSFIGPTPMEVMQ